MEKWTRPDSYMGAEWPEHYVFLSRNRDSYLLDESNFRVALKRLGGVTGDRKGDMFQPEDINSSPDVMVVRESHWACGWIEWIAIHESAKQAIALAEEMEAEMSDYPILDESDYSEIQDEAVCEYWTHLSMRERVEMCAEHKQSIFAARRDCPSDAVYYRLQESVAT